MGEIEKAPKELLKGMPSTKYLATQYMEERGYNPIEKLMDLDDEVSAEDEPDRNLQFQIRKEMAKYFTPQVRSMDVNINQNHSMTVNILKFDDDDEEEEELPVIPIKVEGLEE